MTWQSIHFFVRECTTWQIVQKADHDSSVDAFACQWVNMTGGVSDDDQVVNISGEKAQTTQT